MGIGVMKRRRRDVVLELEDLLAGLGVAEPRINVNFVSPDLHFARSGLAILAMCSVSLLVTHS